MVNRPHNIFAVGLQPFNLRLPETVRGADGYAFHGLLDCSEVATAQRFDLEALLEKARGILRPFDPPEGAVPAPG